MYNKPDFSDSPKATVRVVLRMWTRTPTVEDIMETRIRHEMDRREFIGAAATALLAGVAIQLTGCYSNDGYGTSPTPSSGVNGSIAAPDTENHGHVANLTQTQVDAGAAVSLDISGVAGHSHTVDLTVQDMTDIKAGKKVVKAASNIGHYHTVTFN